MLLSHKNRRYILSIVVLVSDLLHPSLPQAWTSRVLWGPTNRSDPGSQRGHLIPGSIYLTENLIKFQFEFPEPTPDASPANGTKVSRHHRSLELWQSRTDFSGHLVDLATGAVVQCGKPFSQSEPSVVKNRPGIKNVANPGLVSEILQSLAMNPWLIAAISQHALSCPE